MRAQTLLAAAVLAILVPGFAAAETIDVDSTTMLNMATQTRGGVPGQRFDLANTATAWRGGGENQCLCVHGGDDSIGVPDAA